MSKIKSAICLVLFTLLIAGLCFVCTVSFSYGVDKMYTFNSVVRMTAKDMDLGADYGSDGYLGGGYSAVYYPEGVISAKEYNDNRNGYADADAKGKYEAKYVAYGSALYLEKDSVCGGGTAPSDTFKSRFEQTVTTLKGRFSDLEKDGVRLEVRDDYTVRVFLPKDLMTNEFYALAVNAYMGKFEVTYGSSQSAATRVLPARSDKPVTDYVKNASSRSGADGTVYIVINFTKAGREAVKEATESASGSSNKLYFNVAGEQLIPLSVSSTIDQDSLYISGSYSVEAAKTCANLINTALKCDDADSLVSLKVGEAYQHDALYGNNAIIFLYIAFGVCFLAMMVFFFVRYHLLAFAHLYSFLILFYALLLCVWAIPFLYISTETVLAVLIVTVLFSLSNVLVFENARKEYALGKTMMSSVKSAYKHNFLPVFDLHLILAGFSFLVFAISLTNLRAFSFVLGLGVAFGWLATAWLNRLMWAVMMSFTKNKGGFCNFKREEVEDDD